MKKREMESSQMIGVEIPLGEVSEDDLRTLIDWTHRRSEIYYLLGW
jgi:hypothetical protein